MININRQFLVELGLGHLDDRQQDILARRIYEVLQLRVGHVFANSMTNAQLDAFQEVMEEDPEAAQDYLSRTVPHYGPVVRRELESIADAIVKSVRQGTVQVGGPEDHKQADA